MKKMFICVCVCILFMFGCGDNGSIRFEVDETSLIGNYVMNDANFKFISGDISFNADHSLNGEILKENPYNDCLFTGQWFIENNQIIFDIYTTTNSTMMNYGRTEVGGVFAGIYLDIVYYNGIDRLFIRYK